MPQQQELAHITDVLLDDQTGGNLLNDNLEIYRDILLSASGIDLGGEDEMNCIHTGAGVAIGTTWAALCLDDALRTKRFVSGLFQAVSAVMARRPGPVHVLYAGTGPWATLFVPLTTRFTPEQLRVTCLEINPGSLAKVEKTLTALGLSDYVEEYILADAATHIIAGKTPVDVMLSETMQYCLIDEMQVPIVMNLMAQLDDEVIMVPERITLSLGVLTEHKTKGVNRSLGNIFTLDRASLKAYVPQGEHGDFPTLRLPVPELNGLPAGPLAILTTIDVFGNQKLTHYESGLTYPQLVGEYPTVDNPLTAIDFTYQLVPTPLLEMAFLQ